MHILRGDLKVKTKIGDPGILNTEILGLKTEATEKF